MASEGPLTSEAYIEHHLTNLTYGQAEASPLNSQLSDCFFVHHSLYTDVIYHRTHYCLQNLEIISPQNIYDAEIL